VLHPDVELFDLDADQLAAWWKLLLPPAVRPDRGAQQARWAALFLDAGGAVAHGVHHARGALHAGAIPFAGVSRRALAELRRALDVDLLVVVARGALARIAGDVESTLPQDGDYAAQCITALRALRRAAGRDLWLDPPLLELVPPVAAEPLQRTFELLVPSGSALAIYLFDGTRDVFASAIAVVEGGSITVLTTHQGLADALPGPSFARSWRAQYRRALELIDERYAAPSIGVFLEAAAWTRILDGPPDQLMREIAAGAVVIDPAPAWLRGLLGGAQLVSLAGGAARGLARFVPAGARRAAGDLAQQAHARLRESGAHPFALLGFDPIALWHEVRRYYRSQRVG
jgi:hypothetical protein